MNATAGHEEPVHQQPSASVGRRWPVIAVAFTLTAVGIAGWFLRDSQKPGWPAVGQELPTSPLASADEDAGRRDATNSGALVRLDPTGQIVASLPIPRPRLIASDGRSIWVVNRGIFGGNTVVTIEPATGSITALADASGLGIEPSQLAVAGGSAWLGGSAWGDDRERLYRIDPGAVTGDLVRFETVGRELAEPIEAAGSLWVACCTPRALLRVDPTSGEVQARIAGIDRVVASGARFVWAIETGPGGSARRLVRIQTDTHEEAPIDALTFPSSDLAVGFGAVWASSPEDGTIVRLDPVTGEAGQRIDVGRGPGALATGGGAVWVALSDEAAVARYDIGTDRVDVIDVGGEAQALVFAHGSLWVAVARG